MREKQPDNKFEKLSNELRPEVHYLELVVRKNKAQKELNGIAVDERLDTLTEFDYFISKGNPELQEAFKSFLKSILDYMGIDEDTYKRYLDSYLKMMNKHNEDPLDELKALGKDINMIVAEKDKEEDNGDNKN
jgi:hypothetical protein